MSCHRLVRRDMVETFPLKHLPAPLLSGIRDRQSRRPQGHRRCIRESKANGISLIGTQVVGVTTREGNIVGVFEGRGVQVSGSTGGNCHAILDDVSSL